MQTYGQSEHLWMALTFLIYINDVLAVATHIIGENWARKFGRSNLRDSIST